MGMTLTMTEKQQIHICEVNVCDNVISHAGVCEKCEINDLNSGVYLRCGNEDCQNFLCDHCGDNTSTYILGGEGSVFLCCDGCFEVVGKLHASERDYTSTKKHDMCLECR